MQLSDYAIFVYGRMRAKDLGKRVFLRVPQTSMCKKSYPIVKSQPTSLLDSFTTMYLAAMACNQAADHPT